MSFEIRISARASRDADAIFSWLAQHSRTGAVDWYNAWIASLQLLGVEAHGCGTASEADELGIDLRQMLFKTRKGRVYRSLFVVHENRVFVVGLRSPGQDHPTADDLELPD